MTLEELENVQQLVGPDTFSLNGRDVNTVILPDALSTLQEAVGYLELWEEDAIHGDEVRRFLRNWRSQKR